LILVGLTVTAIERGIVPFRISWFWPIDLAQPGSFLIDWRLSELRDDPQLCRKVLKAPQIVASPIADSTEKNGCGWHNGVRISSVNGVRLSVGQITCEMAASLALWMSQVVQPEARKILGTRVVSIQHLGSYACRNMVGDKRYAVVRSAHAEANALDVAVFSLADGRQISVRRQWGTTGPEGQFLKAVHAQACDYFRVALGPAYNAAHHDHFHYDRSFFHACR
jgi:hypothetical protein